MLRRSSPARYTDQEIKQALAALLCAGVDIDKLPLTLTVKELVFLALRELGVR